MIKNLLIFFLSLCPLLYATEKNITDSISENKRLQKLNEFITTANLSSDLVEYENLTLFAPLDDAFAALSAKTYYGYLKQENRGKLESLVNFHFVEGVYTTESINDVVMKKSVDGNDLEIKKINGILYVNGAEVVEPNIKFSNGVIHLINKVLIPK